MHLGVHLLSPQIWLPEEYWVGRSREIRREAETLDLFYFKAGRRSNGSLEAAGMDCKPVEGGYGNPVY